MCDSTAAAAVSLSGTILPRLNFDCLTRTAPAAES